MFQNLRSLILILVLLVFLLVDSCFGFKSSAECSEVLADFATLTNKSVFIPASLSGRCIVNSEKDFPLIFRASGHSYKETGSVITVKPIPEPIRIHKEPIYNPPLVTYSIQFLFVNVRDVVDCGLKMDDILASFNNANFDLSIAGSLGCPALESDGSFAFTAIANFREHYQYSHGFETARLNSEITSATGAVSKSYDYLTTGLYLDLVQDSTAIKYQLRYSSPSGAVTSSSGVIRDYIYADIQDWLYERRKLLFIPLGVNKSWQNYKLILKFKRM